MNTSVTLTFSHILQAISALRAKLSGAADDSGILVNGTSSLVPTDMNAITFARNVSQVQITTTRTLTLVTLLNAALIGCSTFYFRSNAVSFIYSLKCFVESVIEHASICIR